MCFIVVQKTTHSLKKVAHSFTCTDYIYDMYLVGNSFLEAGLYFVNTDTLYTLYVAGTV